jgi:hypothetical protein
MLIAQGHPPPRLATGDIYLGLSENVRVQMARTLREFSLEPRGRAKTYQKPYADFFDNIPYPRGFWVPDFVRFIREDSRTITSMSANSSHRLAIMG